MTHVPILKQGDTLIVTLQEALTDAELHALGTELAETVGRLRSKGLIVDVSALDVLDSFATRMLLGVVKVASLRGARAVIVGIQPDVAFAMVQLGLTLEGVTTALDLEEGLLIMKRRARKARRHAR
jgi:rsbT antagonist protein RsbS